MPSAGIARDAILFLTCLNKNALLFKAKGP